VLSPAKRRRSARLLTFGVKVKDVKIIKKNLVLSEG